ncbi:MAG: MarR family transcriptional regulator [Lachnospiraceae bacterium]|nr:MarR family transcriptional regulator [Lachnospiraceae bacterium]
MREITDYLVNNRRLMKLHENMLKDICGEYQLSLTEATIISFLHNNPEKDTAADITELRMLSKGIVSQSVESLIQKSLLQREQDAADRRKIHLSLMPAAQTITKSIERIQKNLYDEIFAGLSEEEQELFNQIHNRIMENAKAAMNRRSKQ